MSIFGLGAAFLSGFFIYGVGTARAGGPAVGVAASGGHAANAGAGNAHVSSPVSGASSLGSHVGGYHGNGFASMAANYNGSPRYLPGGFTPNVFPSGTGAVRATRLATLRSARSGESTVPFGAGRGGEPNVYSENITPTRSHNAWTDPAPADSSVHNRQTSPGVHAGGGLANGDGRSGTILFPDAPRDVLGNQYGLNGISAGRSGGLYSRFHSGHHRDYSDYGYGYPYGFYGGFPSYADTDIAGVGTGDYNSGVVSGDVGDSNALSADAVGNLSQPYATSRDVLPPTPTDDSPATSINPAPAAAAGANPGANTGSDSLVEAVQAELARRGYFAGKIDAVYNDATHRALQRFQTDQRLSATGRINEATLHALQLD